MKPEDSRLLHELLDNAGRAVQPTHPGWKGLIRLLEKRQRTVQPFAWMRWLGLTALAGTAAAAVMFLWLLQSQIATTLANQPIRVEPKDVELTILSTAEAEGETLYMPMIERLGHMLLAGPPAAPAGNAETVYNGKGKARIYRPQPARKPTGQALVKDHRLVFNLKEGENILRFTDVAATIDPTSVRLTSDQPGTLVKEQNFEYDLATADTLLKRYIDSKIICIGKDGQEIAGYLVSFDDTSIVLASSPLSPGGTIAPLSPGGTNFPLSPGGRGDGGEGENVEPTKKSRKTETLTRRELQAIRLDTLPKDLLVKPTLVWKVEAQKAGQHDMTLAYLCGHIKWQADYVVLVKPSEGLQPDLLDVTGWVSLDNTSGATYKEAVLKLIAGDVNRKRDPWAAPEPKEAQVYLKKDMEKNGKGKDNAEKAKKEFVEKSFFEYHLYTLTAPSTVRDRQIKQLNLLRRENVKANRRYVFDPAFDGRRLGIELTAKNTEENNLGIPLPKGRVTFEQGDADEETAFLGRTNIDHAAVKEELTLKYGYAFDVVGASRLVSSQSLGPRHHSQTNEIRVRNHKTNEIQVRAVARLGTNWKLTKSTMPHQEHDFQTVYFNFTLKPNVEETITYTVEYQY